ncbi:hypothetical protein LMIY3S_02720 [Labrys miyagiensis]
MKHPIGTSEWLTAIVEDRSISNEAYLAALDFKLKNFPEPVTAKIHVPSSEAGLAELRERGYLPKEDGK